MASNSRKRNGADGLEARIAAKAYERYLREGQPNGRALDHWLLAEQEVLGATKGRRETKAAAQADPGKLPFVVTPQTELQVRPTERVGGLASSRR